MKKRVTHRIETLPSFDFSRLEAGDDLLDIINYSSLTDVSDYLTKLQKHLEADGYDNIRLIVEGGYESSYLSVVGDRLETDVEYERRLKKEEQEKEKQKKKVEKDRAKFEKLKKEYGWE